MPVATIASGPELSAWRGRLGWSVQQAADELKILAPSLRNLESGRKAASASLLRLAEVLEQIAAAPAAEMATVAAPVRKRVPKPAPSDPFDAAMRRVDFRETRPEVLAMLRAEVELRAADPNASADGPAYQARDAEWHRLRLLDGRRTTGSLGVCAEYVERQMSRSGRWNRRQTW